MLQDIPLKCQCGAVQGQARAVDPARGNRLVCMCDDCQAYGHWLEHSPSILDANGGTEIFQLTPAQVRIDRGHEQIRCLRLSPKGLMRWHTACCHTPIANTLSSPRVPFLGLPCVFMDLDAEARDRQLGPILARIHGRYGAPPLPANSYARAPMSLIARSLRQLFRGLLQGAHAPHPLFTAGAPMVAPTVLSTAARQSLNSAS